MRISTIGKHRRSTDGALDIADGKTLVPVFQFVTVLGPRRTWALSLKTLEVVFKRKVKG